VNSAFANALVDEALRDGVIPELAGYAWTREAPVPDGDGRFDFRLSRAGAPPCWVEVKSVTLHVGGGLGLFPDAVSDRAVRHVNALARRSASGDRAVLLFCVQHTAIERVDCAREIHPGYAEAVDAARAAGVEVLVYEVDVAPERMALGRRLPFLSNGGP
jgi:sugar fermentation stimulation protein A